MKVERVPHIADREQVMYLWEMYNRIFKEVNTMAAQRHLMNWDEFIDVMYTPYVTKYVLHDHDGRIVGLSTLTNTLTAWPLISPEFFARTFPDYYERDAIWYCGFVGVDRFSSIKPVHGFRALVCEMLEDIHSNNGMTVMDFCTYNVARKRLPHITQALLTSLYPKTTAGRIDSQEFWAYRFDGQPVGG